MRYYKSYSEILESRVAKLVPNDSVVDEKMCGLWYLTFFHDKYKSGNVIKSIENNAHIDKHYKYLADLDKSSDNYKAFRKSYFYTDLNFTQAFLDNYQNRVLCRDSTNLLNYVPVEILKEIFKYLNIEDVLLAKNVCKLWSRVAKSYQSTEISLPNRTRRPVTYREKETVTSFTFNVSEDQREPCEIFGFKNLTKVAIYNPSWINTTSSFGNVTELTVEGLQSTVQSVMKMPSLNMTILRKLHLNITTTAHTWDFDYPSGFLAKLCLQGINLKSLYLRNISTTDKIPISQNNLNELKELTVIVNTLEYSNFYHLAKVPNPGNIEKLGMDLKYIENPREFNNVKELLTSAQVQGYKIPQFESIVTLKIKAFGVCISPPNSVQQELVEAISECKNLKHLEVDHSIIFDQKRLSSISTLKLQSLSIRYADDLFPLLSDLEKLELSMLKKIDKTSIMDTLKNMEKLSHLQLPPFSEREYDIFINSRANDWKGLKVVYSVDNLIPLINYFNVKNNRSVKFVKCHL
jgi:hypothetical protein